MNKPCYLRVMSLPDYKMHFPLTVSLGNKDVLSFLFWKWRLNHRQSVQLAYQRGQQQKRHLSHLPSAFSFKGYFLPVCHAEVKAVLWGQVCAGHTLTCCKTQGSSHPLSVRPLFVDGAVLGQQANYLHGKCTARPHTCPLISFLLTYLPACSTPGRDAQKTFAWVLVLSLSTAPPFSYARVSAASADSLMHSLNTRASAF